MILINSPHNPTGSVLSEEDMIQLEELVKGSSILVLSDEVYEHMVYDGEVHQSAARFPGLAERSFIVASFGKTFHNTGWKMGYCAGPKELMQEFRKIHQFNVFSVNHPIQRALAAFLKNPEHYEYLSAFFESKRDVFLEAIRDSRFKAIPSRGTYFQLLDYGAISEESDMDLARRLTVDHKVASIPVSAFYENRTDHKVLRFCFAKSEETLLRGAEILNTL
jgi:methionine aminotransferase